MMKVDAGGVYMKTLTIRKLNNPAMNLLYHRVCLASFEARFAGTSG